MIFQLFDFSHTTFLKKLMENMLQRYKYVEVTNSYLKQVKTANPCTFITATDQPQSLNSVTFLCSETSSLSCNSISLLATAASSVESHRGGKGGTEDVDPGGHTDFIASPLIGFHLDSSCRSNTQTSTASDG